MIKKKIQRRKKMFYLIEKLLMNFTGETRKATDAVVAEIAVQKYQACDFYPPVDRKLVHFTKISGERWIAWYNDGHYKAIIDAVSCLRLEPEERERIEKMLGWKPM